MIIELLHKALLIAICGLIVGLACLFISDVADAGSWFAYIGYEDGMTTGEWIESLSDDDGC